jgi:hypothetical protein
MYDATGTLLGSYAQIAGASSDTWGHRDGASDGTYVYFGWAGGVARYDADGSNAVLLFDGTNAPGGTYRALAYDPTGDGGNGSFWSANFASVLVEVDFNGNLLTSWPNGGWSLYGLAYDHSTGMLWGHDRNFMGDDSAKVVEIDPNTGLLTGVEWSSHYGVAGPSATGFAIQGGLSALDGTGNLYGVLQGAPDHFFACDTLGVLAPGTLVPNPRDLEIQHTNVGNLGIALLETAPQVPTCPWDCGTPHNKVIDIIDFLALLGDWGVVGSPCDFDGGGVGITDFLKLLGMWGPCPAPLNDECIDYELIEKGDPNGSTQVHYDMYGATPSPEPYKCLPDPPTHKDIWYCLTNATGLPIGVTITTNINLFIEVNAGCVCPPGPVITCGEGLVGLEQFEMQDGEQVLIRLIDYLDLPNDELKGSMTIENKPVGDETVNFFTDFDLFMDAITQAGKVDKFFWDFNPNGLPPDAVVGLEMAYLDITTHASDPDDPWTIDGRDVWPPLVDNVQFSANTNPQGPHDPNTVSGVAFAVPGFQGIDNNVLVANSFVDSFGIISGLPQGANHTAMAFDLISLLGTVPATVHVTVYDKADITMGKFVLEYQGGKTFVGILSKDPVLTIGRVDIWDTSDGAEGVSFIQAFWQPPSP